MSSNRIHCKKCGKKAKHTRHKLEVPHPSGGVTILGRSVPLVAVIGYSECSSCGDRQVVNVEFPLDEDAMLISELFSVDLGDKAELDYAVAWLQENNLCSDDLTELKRLKDTEKLPEILGWWQNKGLPTPQVVLDADGNKHRAGKGVRFLRPPPTETTNDGLAPGNDSDRKEV